MTMAGRLRAGTGYKTIGAYLILVLFFVFSRGIAQAPPASGFRNPASFTIEKSNNNASESWTRYEVAATEPFTDKSGTVVLPLLEVLCFDGGSTQIQFRTGELKRGSDVKITTGNLPTVSLVYGSLPMPYSDTIVLADLKNAGHMANINLKHLAAGLATYAPVRLEFTPSQYQGKFTAYFDTSVLLAEFRKNTGCIQ